MRSPLLKMLSTDNRSLIHIHLLAVHEADLSILRDRPCFITQKQGRHRLMSVCHVAQDEIGLMK